MKEFKKLLIDWLCSDGYSEEDATGQINSATIIICNGFVNIVYKNGISDCVVISEDNKVYQKHN